MTLVPGVGVDLAAFPAMPLPPLDAGLVFLMTAPLDRQSGIETYAIAAEIVAARAPKARFRLLAEPIETEAAPSSGRDGLITRLDQPGQRPSAADHRDALASAHVFVSASSRAGMPQPLLESLAASRPVIATDVPGSRETVDERVNGILVPPGNPAALADAMLSVLARPGLLAAMARASRLKAERRFDGQVAGRLIREALGLA